MPVPVALYAYKYNFKIGLVPSISTFLISFLISTNPISSLVYIFPAMLIGILYGGVLVKSNLRPIFNILIVTGVCLISEVLSSIVLSSILGIENVFLEIQGMINTLSGILSKLDINIINLTFMQAILEGIVPSLLVIISLIDAVFIYLLFMIFILYHIIT